MRTLRNFLLLVFLMQMMSACGAYIISEILNDDEDYKKNSSYNFNIDPIELKDIDIEPICEYDNKIPENRVVQEDEVTLKRHSQRVIRYGCDENNQPTRDIVESDKWEEIEKPRMVYYIRPKVLKTPNKNIGEKFIDTVTGAEKWYENIKGDAINKTTCSSDSDGEDDLLNLLFVGIPELTKRLSGGPDIEKPYIEVDIDLANHYFDMRVHEGVNHIYYEFTEKCEIEDEECKKDPKVLEQGVVVLNVIYDLKEKGVIKEIKYVDNECKEEKKSEYQL